MSTVDDNCHYPACNAELLFTSEIQVSIQKFVTTENKDRYTQLLWKCCIFQIMLSIIVCQYVIYMVYGQTTMLDGMII